NPFSPFSRGTLLPMPGRADRAVAVVIPAYQAAATIADVVSRTRRVVPRAIVYVVDDGSSDGTGKTAERGGTGRATAVLILPRHRGTGAARATETALLLEALALGLRVISVAVPTIYEGRPSHFRRWRDTWRQARVFTRYGRRIIFGAR